MIHRRTLAVLGAGLTVAAMLSAPAAQARPTCRDSGNATTCETNGSVSIVATPGTKAPPPKSYPELPWYVIN